MLTLRPLGHRARRLALLAVTVAVAACRSEKPAPTGVDQKPAAVVPRVSSIIVNPGSLTAKVGDRMSLAADVRDQNGAPMTGQAPTWTSGNSAITSVSGNGFTASAIAVGAGNTTVMASLNGIVGQAAIAVTQANVVAPVATVRVTPSSATIMPGASIVLTATPYDAVGAPLSGRITSWSTDNQAVASVNNGVVTADRPGTATIVATIEGRDGVAIIVVSAPPPSQVVIAITNQLIATVAISVQGKVLGTVPAQSTRQVAVSSAPMLEVSFDVVEPMLNGRLLGDGMSGRWTLTNPTGTVNLTVDNVIGGQYYFAPLITNLTATNLLMAINYGLQAENRCRCIVAIGKQRIFLGYYRLYTNSTVHAFADGSNYTGAFRYFYNFGSFVPRGSGVQLFTFSLFP